MYLSTESDVTIISTKIKSILKILHIYCIHQCHIFNDWRNSSKIYSDGLLGIHNCYIIISNLTYYWLFQIGISFVNLLCFFLSCVCYAFVIVCLYVPCGHLLGKGWPLGSRLRCPTVSLSLSHWYPWSGVVLDCIDSWSLHPFLLTSSTFVPCLFEVLVRPSFFPPRSRYLVYRTPPTVLRRLFWNFTGVKAIVWRCVYFWA